MRAQRSWGVLARSLSVVSHGRRLALPTSLIPVDMLGRDVVPGYISAHLTIPEKLCEGAEDEPSIPYIIGRKDYARWTVPACWLAIIARVAFFVFLPPATPHEVNLDAAFLRGDPRLSALVRQVYVPQSFKLPKRPLIP